MSFEVRAQYDFDIWCPEADNRMFEAAGSQCDFAGTNFGKRDLGWIVATFDEAVGMRKRLQEAGAEASVQENITHHGLERGEVEPSLQFLHHLHNVLVLLGAPEWIADKVDRISEGGLVSEKEVFDLRSYAIGLLDSLKGRFVGLNVVTITTKVEDTQI